MSTENRYDEENAAFDEERTQDPSNIDARRTDDSTVFKRKYTMDIEECEVAHILDMVQDITDDSFAATKVDIHKDPEGKKTGGVTIYFASEEHAVEFETSDLFDDSNFRPFASSDVSRDSRASLVLCPVQLSVPPCSQEPMG